MTDGFEHGSYLNHPPRSKMMDSFEQESGAFSHSDPLGSSAV